MTACRTEGILPEYGPSWSGVSQHNDIATNGLKGDPHWRQLHE